MLSDFFSVTNIAFDVLGYQISWLELSGTIFNLAAVILAARRNILTWPIGIIGVILFGFLFYQINLYADMAEQVYYFIVLGYQISWLELSGTIFNLAAVILAARRNILTWPIGIIGVILFGFLFYQINLYADMAEQVYYFITGVIGWYLWAARTNSKDDHNKVTITTMPLSHNLMWVGAILVSGIALGLVIANIHLWLPAQFPTPADFPILDSITTTTAFAAQYLMMRRKLESWYLWIILDVIAVGLYWHKHVPFVAILYAIFLINAFYGWWDWKNHQNTPEPTAHKQKIPAKVRN